MIGRRRVWQVWRHWTHPGPKMSICTWMNALNAPLMRFFAIAGFQCGNSFDMFQPTQLICGGYPSMRRLVQSYQTQRRLKNISKRTLEKPPRLLFLRALIGWCDGRTNQPFWPCCKSLMGWQRKGASNLSSPEILSPSTRHFGRECAA